MAASLNVLSREVLEEILKFLSPGDLCSVASTHNHHVSQAAGNAEFFSHLGQNHRFKAKIVELGMEAFLNQSRLKNLRQIDLSNTTLPSVDYNRLLNAIANGRLKKLVEMDLDFVDLSGVDPDILGRASVKVETVKIMRTQLTGQQCQRLMDNIRTVDPKPRKFQV